MRFTLTTRLATGGILALALVTACGDAMPTPDASAPPARVATTADLIGPWSPTPLLLDLTMRTSIEAFCRREMGLAPDSTAIVVDARGAGVTTVRMTGRVPGSCNALQVQGNGRLAGAGGGWSGGDSVGPPAEPGAIGRVEMQAVSGGDLTAVGWSVYGQTGPGVEVVTVEVEGQPTILATRENGWFSAWWPVEVGDPPQLDQEGNPRRSPPFVIRSHDAFGNVLDEAFR